VRAVHRAHETFSVELGETRVIQHRLDAEQP